MLIAGLAVDLLAAALLLLERTSLALGGIPRALAAFAAWLALCSCDDEIAHLDP